MATGLNWALMSHCSELIEADSILGIGLSWRWGIEGFRRLHILTNFYCLDGVCLSHRLPAPLAGEVGSPTPLLAEDDGSLTLQWEMDFTIPAWCGGLTSPRPGTAYPASNAARPRVHA